MSIKQGERLTKKLDGVWEEGNLDIVCVYSSGDVRGGAVCSAPHPPPGGLVDPGLSKTGQVQ